MAENPVRDCESLREGAGAVLRQCGPLRRSNATGTLGQEAKKWMEIFLSQEDGAISIAMAIIGVWEAHHGGKGLVAVAQSKNRADLLAENKRLREYEQAVRTRHNGYSPECREAMVNLKEPATPWQAIDELVVEANALGMEEGRMESEAEVERLQAIVDKLPKMADGVPVIDGETVYCRYPKHGIATGTYRAEDSEVVVETDDDWVTVVSISDCYSTRKAAEAAGG